MPRRMSVVLGLALVAVVASCRSKPPASHVEPTVGGMRVSGPFVHENLAVYLIHSDEQDDREFLTLDEGLRDGRVLITEKENAEVGELLIENRSDLPLFLHEGDRVKGGKQDRTVNSSLVLAPKSGPLALPTYCIEPDRWSDDSIAGATFGSTSNHALAPSVVRHAAKVEKDQGRVWSEVAESNQGVAGELQVTLSSSSLNESMDSEAARKISEACLSALGGILEGKSDAVGVAFVVNGTVREADLYPSNRLLAKLLPRLIESYAIEAKVASKEANAAAAPGPEAIVKFLQDGIEKDRREETVAEGNQLSVRRFEGRVKCETEYAGKKVHTQMFGE